VEVTVRAPDYPWNGGA